MLYQTVRADSLSHLGKHRDIFILKSKSKRTIVKAVSDGLETGHYTQRVMFNLFNY